MQRFGYVLTAVGLIFGLATSSAAACGGMWSASTPVVQQAERIILAVNANAGEITAYVQINYEGDAADFAWVLPVPNNPTIDVAETTSFDALQTLTEPRLIFPPRPDCFALSTGTGGGAPGTTVLQAGTIGPYEFAVIEDKDPAALVAWLRDNGYAVEPQQEPLIKSYTDGGMVFVAMKLQGGKGTQDIQPVALTFKSTEIMIPMRLAAVAAKPNTQILTWIFGEAQAAPANTTRLTMRRNDLALINDSGGNNYKTQRTGAIDSRNGLGFVVEYAQPTSALQTDDPLISQLAAQYPYVTRLYGEMSPEEMTVDPTFTFNAELPDLSNVIDLTNRTSPYECASEGTFSDKPQQLHSVRRQQIDADKGNRSTAEEATRDLRRGPLQLFSALAVLGILGTVWWLARRPRRT